MSSLKYTQNSTSTGINFLKKNRLVLVALFLFILFLIPLTASAVPGIDEPLVPCGGTGQADCKFCDFFPLVGNVTNFLLIISIPLAAIAIVIGALIMIASAGNVGRLNIARTIIHYAILGLIIVFGAWIIINLVVVAIGSTSFFIAPWHTFPSCSYSPSGMAVDMGTPEAVSFDAPTGSPIPPSEIAPPPSSFPLPAGNSANCNHLAGDGPIVVVITDDNTCGINCNELHQIEYDQTALEVANILTTGDCGMYSVYQSEAMNGENDCAISAGGTWPYHEVRFSDRVDYCRANNRSYYGGRGSVTQINPNVIQNPNVCPNDGPHSINTIEHELLHGYAGLHDEYISNTRPDGDISFYYNREYNPDTGTSAQCTRTNTSLSEVDAYNQAAANCSNIGPAEATRGCLYASPTREVAFPDGNNYNLWRCGDGTTTIMGDFNTPWLSEQQENLICISLEEQGHESTDAYSCYCE